MGVFQKAIRQAAKLRLALSGPSGSGKTYSALLIASGIVPMDKIAVIDTESDSANLYANLGEYSTLTMEPPYTPQKYIDAIKAAEAEGFELIIVDSLSHAWNGEGGLLDQQGKATDSKYKGNSWAAWREITPLYNHLVETILHSKCHIIATMRAKTEYMQDDSGGRKRIVKVGAAPVQRDGIEYEFTVVFDLSLDHVAAVSKDRTRIFDGQYFAPNPEVGKALKGWLEGGDAAGSTGNVVPQDVTTVKQQLDKADIHGLLEYIWRVGGWSPQELPGYVSKRWRKPYEQVTDSEVYALINEICQYLHKDRFTLEQEYQKELDDMPF